MVTARPIGNSQNQRLYSNGACIGSVIRTLDDSGSRTFTAYGIGSPAPLLGAFSLEAHAINAVILSANVVDTLR
jgi:hypothetical protein